MAYPHHHPCQSHRTAATCWCYCPCQPLPCHHPPPSPATTTTADPLVLSLLSQLLQQNPQPTLHSFDLQTHPQTCLKRSQKHPKHQEKDPFESHSLLSLIHRIDNLESSLHQFSSSSSSLSLRDAAARTIQTHFRAYLVRRSRALRQLRDLASIKSSLSSLKLSFSRQGYLAFVSVSHKAMALLLRLDCIEGVDQMIRDSKRSISGEIVQFLDLIEGVCANKRNGLSSKSVKNIRLVRNDNQTAYDDRELLQHGVGSKFRNVGNDEKKLIENLRERVERIGRMSRALEDDAEDEKLEGSRCIKDKYVGKTRNGVSERKHVARSMERKRVCFVENGNVTRIYDIDADEEHDRISLRDVEEIEDSIEGREDDGEAKSVGNGNDNNDDHGSLQDSDAEKKSMKDFVSKINEEISGIYQSPDGEFTFCAPRPVTMESRANLIKRKPTVL